MENPEREVYRRDREKSMNCNSLHLNKSNVSVNTQKQGSNTENSQYSNEKRNINSIGIMIVYQQMIK